MTEYKWGFWQICGWYGQWSKYHLFIGDAATVCGIYPEPETGHKVVFSEPDSEEDRCRNCLRIERSRGRVLWQQGE